MNTRVQVEHPVTEFITGVDIVKQQLLIASGEKLTLTQDDINLSGHSVECRLNAEDSETFIPSPGKIQRFHSAGGLGVRVDSHIYSGYSVPPNYDSMIGKLITYGDDRETAIIRMRGALQEMIIDGIKTNIPLQLKLMNDPEFVKGEVDIHYLERLLESEKDS
jgi:acetyl-CoA carboxylase biotin carboxylase subunit